MDEKKIRSVSKFLSLVLRHQPELIDLQLDENGWADVEELLSKISSHGEMVSKALLETVVATNDKKRFAFNEDHTRIRANQGHSIEIDLKLEPKEPPVYLLHGTVAALLPSIKENGLQKMSRQHVHLSVDETTAKKVGSRKGNPVILTIRAKEMFDKGYNFYISENGVWLTDHVPPAFIIFSS